MSGGLATRPFFVLCAQLLAVSVIVALFFPLELYLESIGFSPRAAGFILGADALAGIVVLAGLAPAMTSGTARRWLAVGSVVLALALFVEGRATQMPVFAAARLLQGAGFITIITALTVLLVLCIPPARSGEAFGLVSLLRLVPYATVPLLFEVGGVSPAQLGRVIGWAALLALVPLALLVLLPATGAERQAPPAAGWAGIRRSLGNPHLRLLFGATALFYATNAITFYFLKGLGRAVGSADTGLFFTLATVTMIVVRLLASRLFDRYSKTWLASGALVLSGVVALALATGPSRPVWLGLAVACGLGWGVAMPLFNALGFVLSAPADRGLNQNLLFLAIQVGFCAGPLGAGALVAGAGHRVLFAVTAAVCLAAVMLLIPLRRHEPSSSLRH